jgi:predicted oxidoreductase (fatty acid repression mutant protein)
MALVNYTGKNVLGVCLKGGEIVRLLPGINEVNEDHLSTMKTHPLFQSRQNINLIQIMSEKLDKDGKRTVEEMVKNIPQIFDTKLLRKIIESDGRDRVVMAAKDQLEKIKNPSKAKAEDSNEHFA